MDLESGKRKRKAPVRSLPVYRKVLLNVHQGEFFPQTLDEMVDPCDPCRLVSVLVDLLDLSFLKAQGKFQGGIAYDPAMMVKLTMFALWDGERGSRSIEKRCKTDIRYKWLCGGLTPKHTTIWRFRHTLGPKLDDLLAQCVLFGREQGLGGLNRASIDGTKLPSAASQWRKFREEADTQDRDIEQSEESSEKQKKEKKREPLPSKDEDARNLRTRQGHFIVGYNPQVMVDCDADLFVAYRFSNEASDSHQLTPVLYKCLEHTGDLPCELLADAGYDTPMNCQALYDSGIESWVACKERRPFWTLDEKDRPVCPAGHVADRRESFKQKGIRVIRLTVDECPSCPIRSTCLKKKEQKCKTICTDAIASPALWIRQKHKATSPEGKEMLKMRGPASEFGFARMKQRFGFRRLSHWGMKSCDTEFGILLLSMNLATLAAKLGLEKLKELLNALFYLYRALLFGLETFSGPISPSFTASSSA